MAPPVEESPDAQTPGCALVRAYLQEGDTLLDVGCGTGEVSIAAARAGARGVLALDVDPTHLEAAARAVREGGLSDVIRVAYGDVATWPLIPVTHCCCQLDVPHSIRVLPRLVKAVRNGYLMFTRVPHDMLDTLTVALDATGFTIAEVREGHPHCGVVCAPAAPHSGVYESALFHA